MSTFFIVAVPEELSQVTEWMGHPVYYCGVGKVNAAMGVFELVNRGATRLINVGSCGSRRHALGEIIKVGTVYQDIDCTPFCDYGETAFEAGSGSIVLDPSSPHSCFSTDYFYDHQQLAKYSDAYLHQINTCSVFDMELFAMAKVCRRFSIDLHAYKWVSDDGDHEKWIENCVLSSKKALEEIARDHLV